MLLASQIGRVIVQGIIGLQLLLKHMTLMYMCVAARDWPGLAL
jgi:hypothetical protein